MVVIVVALDDCTISVTKAPQNAPDSGVAAALLSVVRSPEPANALRLLVMTLMPSRNRPTPPRTDVAVDMRYVSEVSAARTAASSFFFSAAGFGYVRSSCSTASTIAAATTSRVNHLLSAGTTNQGACLDAVAPIASSYARM